MNFDTYEKKHFAQNSGIFWNSCIWHLSTFLHAIRELPSHVKYSQFFEDKRTKETVFSSKCMNFVQIQKENPPTSVYEKTFFAEEALQVIVKKPYLGLSSYCRLKTRLINFCVFTSSMILTDSTNGHISKVEDGAR